MHRKQNCQTRRVQSHCLHEEEAERKKFKGKLIATTNPLLCTYVTPLSPFFKAEPGATEQPACLTQ